MLHKGLIALLVSLLICSLTACTRSQGANELDPAHKQNWALSDGVVSSAEYAHAVETFINCVRAAEYQVSEPVISPIDKLTLVYDLSLTGDPTRFNNTVQDCNIAHLAFIEPAYIEANVQTMDMRLRQAVADCLTSRGITITGLERNFPDFKNKTKDENVTLDCIIYWTHELFPELPDAIPVRG
jgi:hypothetical protein